MPRQEPPSFSELIAVLFVDTLRMDAEGLVVPGDEIQADPGSQPGCGVYELNGALRASLVGKVVVETLQGGSRRYNVVPVKGGVPSITIGDKVTCRVLRIMANQAQVDILCVNEVTLPTSLPSFPRGIVRREDVRLSNVDTVVMQDCFRPADIIRAQVISLGDARQYFLSTTEEDCGVISAVSSATGEKLVPSAWDKMLTSTGIIEFRKCAKPSS